MPFLKLCATYIDVISILLHYWVHELHIVLHMCVGNARVHVCMLQISKRMPLHAVVLTTKKHVQQAKLMYYLRASRSSQS